MRPNDIFSFCSSRKKAKIHFRKKCGAGVGHLIVMKHTYTLPEKAIHCLINFADQNSDVVLFLSCLLIFPKCIFDHICTFPIYLHYSYLLLHLSRFLCLSVSLCLQRLFIGRKGHMSWLSIRHSLWRDLAGQTFMLTKIFPANQGPGYCQNYT